MGEVFLSRIERINKYRTRVYESRGRMEAVIMADIINFSQLNLSVNFTSFSQINLSGAGSSAAVNSSGLNNGARNVMPAVDSNAGIAAIVNSGSSDGESFDSVNISDSARALSFLKNALTNNGFTAAEADSYVSRYAEDPVINHELDKLFRLLEPLFDDKDKFRQNVEKFMANFAKLTNKSSGSQVKQSLGDLASKVQNIINNKTSSPSAESVARIAAVEVSIEISIVEGRVQFIDRKQTDPLILDMDGNGYELTNADDGALFDIDADGALDKMAVTKGNDAVLALDTNNNGIIDNGKELFGDQNGAADGFSELAKYDGNKDGIIDANDQIFDRLKLLKFVKNANGSYTQKLTALKSSAITAIDLNKIYGANDEVNGSSIVKKSFAYLNNNENNRIGIADALLENYRV